MNRYELEKLALEKYPVNEQIFNNGFLRETVDLNAKARQAFIEGGEAMMLAWMVISKESFDKGYEAGHRKGLAKCPRWKKAERDVNSDGIDFAVKFLNDGGDNADYETVIATNRLVKGEWYVELSDLGELLKEGEN